MDDSVAGVVLAAGAGSRLAPLTTLRPKALCPIDGRPLVDLALDRLRTVTGARPDTLAVNLHHGAAALDAHLPPEVHRSVERPEALGTAGALGLLRPWIAGRPTLVTNADAWFHGGADLRPFVAGWDGERSRLLCVETDRTSDFGSLRYCGVALLPWTAVSQFAAVPSGLYEVSWRAEAEAGRLDLVVHPGAFVDCGTPADYLEANLLASGGGSVIDVSATVDERAVVEQSVVWPGSRVAAGEVLRRVIRAGDLTVTVN